MLFPTPDSPPPGDRRFDQRPLLDEPQNLLVPEGHPLAGRDGVRLEEAAHEHWIASPERADQYRLLLSACASAGFTPHVAHGAREWFAVSALVAHGFGVCLVPRLAPVPPEHPVRRVLPAERVSAGRTAYSRGSTGSDSRASTANTGSCTRHSGSPRACRSRASRPSLCSRMARPPLRPTLRSRRTSSRSGSV